MTRLMIIGSSHVGAYKNASDAFALRYPQVTLTFFGVRGPLFLTGKTDDQGRFTPPVRSKKDRAFVTATNGTLVADTQDADHLLVVGHRFGFLNIATLLEDHDILEGIRTGRPRLLSEALLRDVTQTLTRTAVDKAAAAFATTKTPMTFAMAPYPASSIVERGDDYALARSLRLFWARPDAVWVFDLWRTALRAALADHGHGLLEQPDVLNDGPHATKPEYAALALGLDGDTLQKTDHRHMNADYGLAMLCGLADTTLGLGPGADTLTPTERIA